MSSAYDDNIYVDDRTIDSHIKRLRKKFKSIDKKGIDLLHQYSEKKIAKELSVAAIRELWEEAGLRLCAKVDAVGKISPGWEDFCNDCYSPDASNLEYVFRAITPPGRPRRFDARFFICRAENVYGSLDDFSSASTELSHLQWIDIDNSCCSFIASQ